MVPPPEIAQIGFVMDFVVADLRVAPRHRAHESLVSLQVRRRRNPARRFRIGKSPARRRAQERLDLDAARGQVCDHFVGRGPVPLLRPVLLDQVPEDADAARGKTGRRQQVGIQIGDGAAKTHAIQKRRARKRFAPHIERGGARLGARQNRAALALQTRVDEENPALFRLPFQRDRADLVGPDLHRFAARADFAPAIVGRIPGQFRPQLRGLGRAGALQNDVVHPDRARARPVGVEVETGESDRAVEFSVGVAARTANQRRRVQHACGRVPAVFAQGVNDRRDAVNKGLAARIAQRNRGVGKRRARLSAHRHRKLERRPGVNGHRQGARGHHGQISGAVEIEIHARRPSARRALLARDGHPMCAGQRAHLQGVVALEIGGKERPAVVQLRLEADRRARLPQIQTMGGHQVNDRRQRRRRARRLDGEPHVGNRQYSEGHSILVSGVSESGLV